MGVADVLYRRTALAVVVLLSLMIGFIAVDPFNEAAVFSRITMLVVVAVLITGILPGSYLQRRIRSASQTESVARSRLLRVMAVVAPVLLVTLFSFLVYDGYYTLSFRMIDRGEVNFRLVRAWSLNLTSLVLLVLNTVTLFRKRTHGRTPPT